MTSMPLKQQGFAAIAAIFLVVVLAALGGFMVSFSNTQHLTVAQDYQGARAYWAARAGVEWGVGRVVTACPASPTTLSLEGFSVVVTCSLSTYTEEGAAVRLFRFTSVGSSLGSVGDTGFIERSVSGTLER